MTVLLYYKGYIALQAWRVSHRLWSQRRYDLALFLHSCATHMLDVSIHPSAVIGSTVVIDHGSGIIIGATVAVGDDVTILQNVTIGPADMSTSPIPQDRQGCHVELGRHDPWRYHDR